MNPQLALEALITWLSDATFLPVAVPAVVFLTALLKRMPGISAVPAGFIAIACQVILWIIWIVARRAGVEEAVFRNALDAFITVLSAISLIVLGSGATEELYQRLHRQTVTLLGTSRKQPLIE
jgi:hypothetical protein